MVRPVEDCGSNLISKTIGTLVVLLLILILGFCMRGGRRGRGRILIEDRWLLVIICLISQAEGACRCIDEVTVGCLDGRISDSNVTCRAETLTIPTLPVSCDWLGGEKFNSINTVRVLGGVDCAYFPKCFCHLEVRCLGGGICCGHMCLSNMDRFEKVDAANLSMFSAILIGFSVSLPLIACCVFFVRKNGQKCCTLSWGFRFGRHNRAPLGGDSAERGVGSSLEVGATNETNQMGPNDLESSVVPSAPPLESRTAVGVFGVGKMVSEKGVQCDAVLVRTTKVEID